jgi:uncharacterized membrane-anchored protein YhcB (DUF1043 family)
MTELIIGICIGIFIGTIIIRLISDIRKSKKRG